MENRLMISYGLAEFICILQWILIIVQQYMRLRLGRLLRFAPLLTIGMTYQKYWMSQNSIGELSQIQAILDKTVLFLDKENDIQDQIRRIQADKTKKRLLIIHSRQTKQQFHQRLSQVLQNVGRITKDKVVIIKTNNEKALKTLFKINPDPYTTIRLVDPSSYQPSLFALQSQSATFSRYKFQGAFKSQNLCNFIQSAVLEEYYENKGQLTTIKPIQASELNKLDNTLVLLEKQSCNGCHYLRKSLEQIKNIGQRLKGQTKTQNGKKYGIEYPSQLSKIKIRRCSVFNQHQTFTPPSYTPKMYFYYQGKAYDIKVQELLSNVKKYVPQQANEKVIEGIIARTLEKQRNLSQSSDTQS